MVHILTARALFNGWNCVESERSGLLSMLVSSHKVYVLFRLLALEMIVSDYDWMDIR